MEESQRLLVNESPNEAGTVTETPIRTRNITTTYRERQRLVYGSVVAVTLVAAGLAVRVFISFDNARIVVFGTFAVAIVTLLASAVPVSVIVLTTLLFLTLANKWVCQVPLPAIQLSTLPNSVFGECSSSKHAFEEALAGFALPLSWLVWAAFNLGLAVNKSRLAKRISLLIISYYSTSPFALGPALFLIEMVAGCLIPSNTARGGALIFPIVSSLSTTLQNPFLERYLILCGLHANLLSSSAFFYGTVGNPIVAESAELVFEIEFGFLEWLYA
ncbi:hypothetical protein HK100_005121 [Physocladia obscura]|uniref:Uncharacterized protein n=1 Tax=Physocladia obscura TaxID=109957 RepID=A0AAD5XJD0_9FUNG|nr:hypothetical protein HK100_005121 [Physocladia obscura]